MQNSPRLYYQAYVRNRDHKWLNLSEIDIKNNFSIELPRLRHAIKIGLKPTH